MRGTERNDTTNKTENNKKPSQLRVKKQIKGRAINSQRSWCIASTNPHFRHTKYQLEDVLFPYASNQILFSIDHFVLPFSNGPNSTLKQCVQYLFSPMKSMKTNPTNSNFRYRKRRESDRRVKTPPTPNQQHFTVLLQSYLECIRT